MTTIRCLIIFFMVSCAASFAQVDDIKQASKENSSSKGSGGDRGNSGGGGNVFFFFDMFRVLGTWQGHVLDKRTNVPQVVGLDVMLHSAIQPSSYYTFNPRIHGTWGILSTDFRWNGLVEKTVDGYSSLNTFDWQIVQLNFVNTEHVIVRAGVGFMQENFSDHLRFFESTISSNIMLRDNRWGGFVEWRSANDYETNAKPRREFNVQVQRTIFESGSLHGLVTGGLQFQRWYSLINVWGMQGGFVLRIY